SDKPGLVAEYTKEDKNGNQADEDYLLPHSISYDNPNEPKSPFDITTFSRALRKLGSLYNGRLFSYNRGDAVRRHGFTGRGFTRS
ncbi:MAG TPA: hypothetical protein VIH69_05110, partial [Dehalococcoidia bacterium]